MLVAVTVGVTSTVPNSTLVTKFMSVPPITTGLPLITAFGKPETSGVGISIVKLSESVSKTSPAKVL
ncbi:hypothetical protein D3C80_2069990 [compost metagenome]